MTPASPDCAGFCRDCGREHVLPAGPAEPHARELMAELERCGSIGLGRDGDPRLGLEYLHGPARGQMFGVLACRDRAGREHVLKAFSGQYNGIWLVPGWVPPILDPQEFMRVTGRDEPRIKELTRRIAALPADAPLRRTLLAGRRELSRDLMARIFDLYRLTNFRGLSRSLAEVFPGRMPTGTGECCAPKLLHHAARLGLAPLGLAEFYLGRENKAATRAHGHFYAPCEEKCRPILGFLLCGARELRQSI